MNKVNPLWLSVLTIILTNVLTNLVTHYAIFQGIAASEITGMAVVLASTAVGAAYLGIGWVSVRVHFWIAAEQAKAHAIQAVAAVISVSPATAQAMIAQVAAANQAGT